LLRQRANLGFGRRPLGFEAGVNVFDGRLRWKKLLIRLQVFHRHDCDIDHGAECFHDLSQHCKVMTRVGWILDSGNRLLSLPD